MATSWLSLMSRGPIMLWMGSVLTRGAHWHGWQFNVTTGQQQINDRIVHTAYPLRRDGDDIYIQFPT